MSNRQQLPQSSGEPWRFDRMPTEEISQTDSSERYMVMLTDIYNKSLSLSVAKDGTVFMNSEYSI